MPSLTSKLSFDSVSEFFVTLVSGGVFVRFLFSLDSVVILVLVGLSFVVSGVGLPFESEISGSNNLG